MLIIQLSTEATDAIRIGGHTTISINHVQGKKVDLSIDAPADVNITRAELLTTDPAFAASVVTKKTPVIKFKRKRRVVSDD